MTYIERNSGGNPEGALQQPSPITDRLILAHSSRLHFESAAQIANAFSNSLSCVAISTLVGSHMAEAGLDPSTQLQQLEDFVTEGQRHIAGSDALYGIAQIHLALDHPKDAFASTSREQYFGRPRQPYADLDIARKMAQLRQDPSIAIDRGLSHAGNIVVRNSERTHVVTDDHVKAWDYALIARAQYDVGIDHGPTLAHAYELAGRLGQNWQPFNYVYLAEAYGATGDFERAIQIADDIQDERHGRRGEALKAVTQIALDSGAYDVAMEAAHRLGSNLFTSETAAKAVIEAVSRGETVDALIDTALDYVSRPLKLYKRVEGKDAHADADKAKQAEVYALIARASGLRGKDPTEHFNQALSIVPIVESELWQASICNEIARNQALIGIDARQPWKQAVDTVSEILRRITNADLIDRVECIMELEEYVEAQIECGYYGLALDIAKRVAEAEQDEAAAAPFQAKVFSSIALRQAKEGLSPDELRAVPGDVIKSIFSGENETAKAAATYFGLTG